MKLSAVLAALEPAIVVTTTSAEPGFAVAGATALIWPSESTTKLLAGTPPKLTPLTEAKSVPAIVTFVPPLNEPDLGETDKIVGAG